MHRRSWMKSVLGLGLAPYAFPSGKKRTAGGGGGKIIKPKRLAKGDRVGLIAPASNAWENEEIRYAMDIIESMGFRVKPGEHLFARHGYLAGEDRQRADDVNRMFADPEVHAVMALRGGFGTPRILPMIDYELIRKNPKALIGYSDLTALLHAVQKNTGMVVFHGPIARQSFSDYTLAEFKKVLMEPAAPVSLGAPPAFEPAEGRAEWENRLTPIVSGKARGPLMGGNLSLLCKLLGTPYQPDFTGRILVLEDISEPPYRIDGMLTHLWLAGCLSRCAGIVLGKFTDCGPTGSGNSLSLEQVFEDRFKPMKIPTIRGMMIGHVSDQTTLPLGIEAELDVDEGVLTLLDTGVE